MSVEPIPGIQIGPFLEKHGFRSVSISETQSGRNSRVLKVIGESREAILKAYHQSSGCLHDRLHAEYSFLTVLSSDPTIPVATPLGFDGKLALGLYEMLPGSAVTEVSEGDVNQASQFIEQINQLLRKSLETLGLRVMAVQLMVKSSLEVNMASFRWSPKQAIMVS